MKGTHDFSAGDWEIIEHLSKPESVLLTIASSQVNANGDHFEANQCNFFSV
jgi:hypothetical protein